AGHPPGPTRARQRRGTARQGSLAMSPSWIFLFVAGLFEVGWAAGLKASEGLTRPWWAAGTLVAMLASLGFLGLALRHLPLGPAYAVWTGIGTVGASLI